MTKLARLALKLDVGSVSRGTSAWGIELSLHRAGLGEGAKEARMVRTEGLGF